MKGKRKPIVRQMNNISWSMMNKGDSYVLDVPEYNKTIVWRGANSNRCNDVQHESFKSSSKTLYT